MDIISALGSGGMGVSVLKWRGQFASFLSVLTSVFEVAAPGNKS